MSLIIILSTAQRICWLWVCQKEMVGNSYAPFKIRHSEDYFTHVKKSSDREKPVNLSIGDKNEKYS